MGRSVSVPSAAMLVAYASFDQSVECPYCDENCQIDGETCAECEGTGTIEEANDTLVDDYIGHLRYLFPSITTCSKWIGREDHVVGENGHATFGISEYCGLVAYWAVPKSNLGERWLQQIEPKFKRSFGQLVKLGTFSNGEGVYERID